MSKANLEKAGGIIAFVAGIAQAGPALVALGIGSMVDQTFGRLARAYNVDESTWWLALILGYVTVVIGALLISGAKGKIPGIALVICAILSAVAGGGAGAILAIMTLTGGIIALIGGFGGGGSGLRGMMATAQRMAEAAKDTDAEIPPERRIE